jgi:AsmA protein
MEKRRYSMKKVMKWLCIIVGGLLVLVIAALLIVPRFVDIQKYKPEIEKRVTEATGRPFTLGGDISLSLFPWVGVSLSDLHLGNPPDFKEKDFLSVKSFEVRVKLLPLLLKDIQVKRFVLEGPRIVLERNKKGRGNWEGIGKPSVDIPAEPSKKKEKPPEAGPGEGLPIKALAVGEFAITGGDILWIDQVKGERKEISDVSLRLEKVSLDHPIPLAFSAKVDGLPLSLDGKVGPIGKDPGKGTVPLELSLKAMKQLDINLKGKITDPATLMQFDMALQISPFSPRKLIAALGQALPVKTSDPKVLNRLSLNAKVKGSPQTVSISDGTLDLDESKVIFSLKAMDFSRPDLSFDLKLDQIDMDRYLPPASEKSSEEKKTKAPASKGKVLDYIPLRRLVLDGSIRVEKLKAHGAKLQDIYLKLNGKNGRFHLNPLSLKLYEGGITAKGDLDVGQDTPKINMELQATGIQVQPLLKDFLQKDFLAGTIKADAAVRMAGSEVEGIKRTLNGKGNLLFNDGAILGIDLAGMVRNVTATFGLAEKTTEKPRTDFSELRAPFTITNGVLDTRETSLVSPLLRVLVTGKADLVRETLDFRVQPKFVGTLKGQGDTKKRTGIMVPVLVTGSFTAPKFRPDLRGMLKQGLEGGFPEPSELKKLLPGQTEGKEGIKGLEEKAKGLLKSLPLGQ